MKEIYQSESRARQAAAISGDKHPNWRGGKVKGICQECGKEFLYYPSQNRGQFCCLPCANRAIAKKNTGVKNPNRSKFGENNNQWKGGLKQYTCVLCGEAFQAKPSAERECCSRVCAAKLQMQRDGKWFGGSTPERNGEANPNWRGGVTPLEHRPRGLYRYAQWRESVLKRDNYTCQGCGTKDNVQAHHIKSFNDYPELRFDISNGKALCAKCHSKTHK